MSSNSLLHVAPPDIYHRHGLSGMDLTRSAVNIRNQLVREGRWSEIERYEADYIRAIQEGLDEVDRLRSQVMAQIAQGSCSGEAQQATVADRGLGTVAVGGRTAGGAGLAQSALKANLSAAGDASGEVVSVAGLLAHQKGGGQQTTLADYAASVRKRLAVLVPVSDQERERVAELARTLDELSRSSVDVAGARRMVDDRLAAIERDLSSGGEKRVRDLATYLALCRVLGERPNPRDYAHVRAEITRLERALVERRTREVVARKVSAALERAGLTEVGTVVLNDSPQCLLVADGERECGLALSEDGKGSFMLTTVASSDPSAASRERRASIEASARRLCSTKQQRLLEELEKEGLVAAIRDDDDVDLDRLAYCRELELVVAGGNVERTRADRSGRQAGHRVAGEQ